MKTIFTNMDVLVHWDRKHRKQKFTEFWVLRFKTSELEIMRNMKDAQKHARNKTYVEGFVIWEEDEWVVLEVRDFERSLTKFSKSQGDKRCK